MSKMHYFLLKLKITYKLQAVPALHHPHKHTAKHKILILKICTNESIDQGLQQPKCIISYWYWKLLTIQALDIIILSDCHNVKIDLKKNSLLIAMHDYSFCKHQYTYNFDNVHSFFKQTILLSIRHKCQSKSYKFHSNLRPMALSKCILKNFSL